MGTLLTDALSTVECQLDCDAFGGARVEITGLTFYEALSEPYGAELAVVVGDRDLDIAQALGKDVALRITRQGDVTRRLCGIIREVSDGEQSQGESEVEEASRVRLVVVPALWMLSRRRDTRIFQDKSAPEILEEVLNGALSPYGREVRLSLGKSYPKREHCVQYQETDLDFAHRLMEEEGIFYAFDHEGDVEVAVLMDANDACPRIDAPAGGLVSYQPHNMVIRVAEPVNLVHRRHRTTTTSVVIGDWDWTRASMPFKHEQRAQDALGRERESYEHGAGKSLTIHSYAGRSYGAEDGAAQKSVRHEAHVRDAITIEGAGRVVGFAPGKTFELTGHPTLGMDGEYLVVRVIHQTVPVEALLGTDGDSTEEYHNRFECIPVATPFRMPRVTPKPRVTGIQTAVVTGPAGEEIHVDEHGRIKVQFHWDRLGANDEKSSCWIRVEQAWAGSGWGFWYVPRIGMEVVVQLVDGDLDRPLVTGCVYNAANPLPYSLPAEKTKSTMKSNSSLGGGGFNEFRYEDSAGSEEIYTHAQKDYNEVVENDHNTLVHHDQTNTVDNDQTQTIGANQSETVHGNQVMTVDANRTVHVKGNFDETVDGTETRHVVADVTETFDANETRSIGANLTEDIGGNETRTISANQDETISGSHTQTVGGSATHTITGSLAQSITGGITTATPGAYTITATAGYTITAAGGLKLVSPAGVQMLSPAGVTWADSFFAWVGGEHYTIALFSSSAFVAKADAVALSIGATVVNAEACSFAVANTVNKNTVQMAKIRAVGTRLSAIGAGIRNWAFGNEAV